VAGIGAAELGDGERGVALHNGRALPVLDEAHQRTDEVGTVRAGVDALQAVEAVLHLGKRCIWPPQHRQVVAQRLLGVPVRVHHLLPRQVERRQ
jgi:hypothetical protein